MEQGLQAFAIGEVFSLADLYEYSVYFKEKYPDNMHVEAKIRQILQYLRDDGIIDFVNNNGEYKRLK